MTRIAHVTTVHRWDDVRIFQKMCSSLAAQGYDVHLVAPCSNGERASICNGVKIHFIETGAGRVARVVRGNAILFRLLRIRADLYHIHDPELVPLGLFLRACRRQVVFDFHEDLPEQLHSKDWIPHWLRVPLSLLCIAYVRFASATCTHIFAATPKIASRLRSERTTVVQNFPDLEEFQSNDGGSFTPYLSRPNNVAYLGALTHIRGCVEMVRAMELLPRCLNARLVLLGTFRSSDFQQSVAHLPGWRRTSFEGWKDRKGVSAVLNCSRAGLVVLHPRQNYMDSFPVKMFEYMAAGLPVIASDFPLWRQIIDEVGCGILVDPRSPEQIAEAVAWVLSHPVEAEEMGMAGREAVRGKYNWAWETQKLYAAYDRLVGGACPCNVVNSCEGGGETE